MLKYLKKNKMYYSPLNLYIAYTHLHERLIISCNVVLMSFFIVKETFQHTLYILFPRTTGVQQVSHDDVLSTSHISITNFSR